MAHSGCSLYKSLSSETISGSNQIPNFIPKSLILEIKLAKPPLILFSLTYQSPRPELSESRLPNHPSSKTNISIPIFEASLAISNIFFSSKSK